MGLKNNSLDHLFVPISLSSVSNSNPDTEIYFLNINDNYPVSIPGIININSLDSYEKSRKEINIAYKHLSTNAKDFELFCMERFFTIRDFMKSKKIQKAFLVETDVLIFENLNSFINKNGGLNIDENYLSENKCISLGFVSLDYLDYYCEYIIDCYSDINKFKKIEEQHEKYIKKGGKGGICDMTFCDYINRGAFNSKEEFKTKNISDIFHNNDNEEFLFDSFIGRDFILNRNSKLIMKKSYIDEKIIKKVEFNKRKPYVEFENGKLIKMASIHCQGNAKSLMATFFVNSISRK